MADEDVVITLSSRNYAKRMPLSTYRAQHRGGRGVIGMQTRDEDDVQHLVVASSQGLYGRPAGQYQAGMRLTTTYIARNWSLLRVIRVVLTIRL